jgi:hypothetical protein
LAEQLGDVLLIVAICHRPYEKQVAPDTDADQTFDRFAQGHRRSRTNALKIFLLERLLAEGRGQFHISIFLVWKVLI